MVFICCAVYVHIDVDVETDLPHNGIEYQWIVRYCQLHFQNAALLDK